MSNSESSMFDISRAKVAGFGGLGLVVMAVVVASSIPQLWTAMLAAIVGGVVLGGGYIAYRRRQGPLNWDKTWQDKPESKFHHL